MKNKVSIIGLGYVGLPLAAAFGARRPTVGYDVNPQRIAHLRCARDSNGEAEVGALAKARFLELTNDARDCAGAQFVIVAVPTPVDDARRPDFGPLVAACETVGEILAPGATVVFESTVYPGATEEICVPVVERRSGLVWRQDFHVAYSPERINPGDAEHTVERIVKLVAADDAETLERVGALYSEIVSAGIYRVDSIATAEAAKVIENTQRDLNIALVNELAIIFDRLGLDTLKVLEAAGTKWNFLPFRPGLVGGHCIGVDPYYLTYKAQMVDYHPEVILAGRRINDGMGKFVAEKTVKTMAQAGVQLTGARIALLGVTFKENCPDLRNSQVRSIVEELRSYGSFELLIHDPVANADDVGAEYGCSLCQWPDIAAVDALIIAVAHDQYRNLTSSEILSRLNRPAAIVDVKSLLPAEDFRRPGLKLWRL